MIKTVVKLNFGCDLNVENSNFAFYTLIFALKNQIK